MAVDIAIQTDAIRCRGNFLSGCYSISMRCACDLCFFQFVDHFFYVIGCDVNNLNIDQNSIRFSWFLCAKSILPTILLPMTSPSFVCMQRALHRSQTQQNLMTKTTTTNLIRMISFPLAEIDSETDVASVASCSATAI